MFEIKCQWSHFHFCRGLDLKALDWPSLNAEAKSTWENAIEKVYQATPISTIHNGEAHCLINEFYADE